MQAVRRSVQNQVKIFGKAANALQSAPQQGAQILHRSKAARAEALKGSFMSTRKNPGLVWNARSIRTSGNEIPANFHQSQILAHFLRNDVAEDTTLFCFKVLATGPQFVEHTTRNEGRTGQLKMRMLELL